MSIYYCCHIVVVIVMWQKVFFTRKTKTKSEYPIIIVEEMESYYIKHNKTLCDFNV
jgi:hypothetical protein